LTSPRPNGTGLGKYLIDYKYMNFPTVIMSICLNTMAQLVRPRPGERKVSDSNLTPVAGLIFETKNRAIFLERFFGRGITAREQVSRAVILARF